jgi:2-methylcitrate dehydratase PrpD
MGAMEKQLAEFVLRLQVEQIPPSALTVIRRMVMAVIGTGFAGAAEDGVGPLRGLLKEEGGSPQATTLVFGDKLPAKAAAQFNGTLCRALDFCDAMAPGPHIGAALFPAALAAAEWVGGCSGAEFLAALTAGAELSSRLNLTETQYNGFDPTGIAVVFSATAAAARILKLDAEQTLNALALAFNRCGGSFQSHVDGSLGVRVVQGWVAQAGVECAQMALRGITGPQNFLTGHYGYAHLYGRDTLDPTHVVAGLGSQWKVHNVVFKKYPSCGVTQGVTELTLALIHERGLQAQDVIAAQVTLPPYAHRLVGHAFQVGSNPRVDAQFSAAYCVANALVRRSSQLQHFAPAQVHDAVVQAMIQKISVVADPALDARGHTAVDLCVTTADGQAHRRSLDIAPGFPGAELDDAQHLARFKDCLAYAPHPMSDAQVQAVLNTLNNLSQLSDVRELLPLLTVH